MNRVLVLAAVSEAATGVALLMVPSLVGRLLFGEELTGVDTRTGVNDLDYQVPFRRNDSQAGVAFIDKIVTPVLNEMFESGTIQ